MSASLGELNAALERGEPLPDSLRTEWLWRSKADEPPHPEVLLNRCHLLGLLVCRHLSLRAGGAGDPPSLHGESRLSVVPRPAAEMTWRELKDTVANLQIEWVPFLARLGSNPRGRENLAAVRALLERCLCRFGVLAWGRFGPEVLDDPQDTQPAPGDPEGELVLTPSSLRRMLGTLLAFGRHLHLLGACETLPRRAPGLTNPVNRFHHEASTDTFHKLCMYNAVPVGAVLNYKDTFIGQFNSVSQTVFYHNPQYERTLRCKAEDVPGAPALHVLPDLLELHPEIPLRYEEDEYDPTAPGGWYWLLIPGRIYLVTPEPRVLYSEDALALLDVYTATREFADSD